MSLKPGTRLKSVTDTTEVVIVRAGPDTPDLCCGGVAMVPHGAEVADADASPVTGFDEGTKIGKRYEHVDAGLEVLCTKAGTGSLSIGSVLMTLKDAKPLPSSD